MINTPGQILVQFLVSYGLASKPSSATAWPMTYGGSMDDLANNALIAKSVSSQTEGKIQKTGETVRKPRLQISCRSQSHETAEVKLNDILAVLSALTMQPVVIGAVTYIIHACEIIMDTAFLMQEEKNRRQVYVATVQLTITEQE